MTIRPSVLLLAVALPCAAVGGCRGARQVPCEKDALVVVGFRGRCVADVRLHASRLEVAPVPECPWESLVNLSIFEGSRPGMDFANADAVFGKPDEVGRNEFGPFRRYRRPLGIVQIGKEDQSSLIVPNVYWTLRAYYSDSMAAAIFAPEVIERLPAEPQRLEVAILNGCGYPMVSVNLDAGKVQGVAWLENPGSYHPERLHAWQYSNTGAEHRLR